MMDAQLHTVSHTGEMKPWPKGPSADMTFSRAGHGTSQAEVWHSQSEKQGQLTARLCQVTMVYSYRDGIKAEFETNNQN